MSKINKSEVKAAELAALTAALEEAQDLRTELSLKADVSLEETDAAREKVEAAQKALDDYCAANMTKAEKLAAQIAVLKAALETAEENCLAVTGNTESSSEEIAAAEKSVIDAQAALDALDAEKTDKKPKKLLAIKFLLSPSGRFNLAYHEGESCEIDAKQAHELVDLGYAEFLK